MKNILDQDQPDYSDLPFRPNMARAIRDRWLYGDPATDDQAEAEKLAAKADTDKARDMARRRLERTRYWMDQNLQEQRQELHAGQSSMFRFD